MCESAWSCWGARNLLGASSWSTFSQKLQENIRKYKDFEVSTWDFEGFKACFEVSRSFLGGKEDCEPEAVSSGAEKALDPRREAETSGDRGLEVIENN